MTEPNGDPVDWVDTTTTFGEFGTRQPVLVLSPHEQRCLLCARNVSNDSHYILKLSQKEEDAPLLSGDELDADVLSISQETPRVFGRECTYVPQPRQSTKVLDRLMTVADEKVSADELPAKIKDLTAQLKAVTAERDALTSQLQVAAAADSRLLSRVSDEADNLGARPDAHLFLDRRGL
ncbi:hypothetical protein HK104_003253 [Borealophlyctis nickersoniae]|nr:hypothetical protein HK104_003253 [Borealophlyctis nickersoniae]